MTTQPFPSIEKALRQVIEEGYSPAFGHVGIAMRYAGEDPYVLMSLVSGVETATEGSWTFDIDVFGSNYNETRDHAAGIAAALLYPSWHRTTEMLIDSSIQTESPHLTPWGDDESVYRLTATYVFTARRSG